MKFLKLTVLFTALVLSCLVQSCAVPGPKYIDITYSGTPDPGPAATLGISRFTDARVDQAKGALGHRTLNDNSKEIYLVQGMDLATTLTDTTQTFLEKKGLTVTQAKEWTPTLEGLAATAPQTDYLLTAQINTFGLTAKKKGGVTHMTLEIDIQFFLAQSQSRSLTTIPVNLTLTRTDINFTRAKLETFFNETLAEALSKALTLK